MTILLIDNYDSFTYNLYQAAAEMHPNVQVVRNDRISLEEIERLKKASKANSRQELEEKLAKDGTSLESLRTCTRQVEDIIEDGANLIRLLPTAHDRRECPDEFGGGGLLQEFGNGD